MVKKSIKVLNLTNIELTAGEIEILLLGLSFTPLPRGDIYEFEKDIFQFTRKLRLCHFFANKPNPDESLLKTQSTWIPKRGKCVELENMVQPLEEMNVWYERAQDNIPHLRNDLKTLINRTKNNELIIKPADKGEIIVLQTIEDYKEMCLRHLDDEDFYRTVQEDPSDLVQNEVRKFAEKFKTCLTNNEVRYLMADGHK